MQKFSMRLPCLVMGLLESDWYPKPLFLVYQIPPAGAAIALDYKMELARVMVIPRPHPQPAQPLSETEWAAMEAAAEQYTAEEKSTPRAWLDARGQRFTHLYKLWSQRHRS